MTTNVPPIVFSSTGIAVPTDAQILAGVQLDNNAAFGGNLNPALETPQGQLASSLSAIISDKDAQIAYLINQLDPTFASGRFQDVIGKIYFITRIPGSGTVVTATCTGINGTVIPIGSLAKNGATGEIYTCTIAGTITAGVAAVTFTNNNFGANACPINALNTIYQSIPGWESITNISAGILGSLAENRSAFENRRRASVAINANGYTGSIRANVLQVPGVLSCYVYDNNTASTATVGGVSIAAYSVYVAVVGGSSSSVAYAIWRKKSAGAPYASGNTTVVVNDTSYPMPYPAYNVTYTVPGNVPIYFIVNISINALLPSTINTLINQAIIDTFSGANGSLPVQIGYAVFAAKFYAPIGATDPACNVVSVFVGNSPSPTLTSVPININQYPTITAANIVINQV